MDKLTRKVHKVLTDALPRAVVQIDPPRDGRQLSGTIVWSGFRRNDQMGRQQRVRKLLNDALTPAERKRISIFFNFTPSEWKSIEEDRLAEEESILRTADTIRRERAWKKKFLAAAK